MLVYSQIAYKHAYLLWLIQETELRGEDEEVSERRDLGALRGVFFNNCGTHTAMEARDGRELGDSLACVSSYKPVMEAWKGTGHWPLATQVLCHHQWGQSDQQLLSSHHQTSHTKLAEIWVNENLQSLAQTKNLSHGTRCWEGQADAVGHLAACFVRFTNAQELSPLSFQVKSSSWIYWQSQSLGKRKEKGPYLTLNQPSLT